jgi:hypothetical protein
VQRGSESSGKWTLAFSFGHADQEFCCTFQVCQWLHETVHCALDLECLCNAARRGDLSWLQWILAKTPAPEMSGSLIDQVKRKRQEQVLVWITLLASLFGCRLARCCSLCFRAVGHLRGNCVSASLPLRRPRCSSCAEFARWRASSRRFGCCCRSRACLALAEGETSRTSLAE